MAKIRIPFTDVGLTSKEYRLIQALLVPGQTLVTAKRGEFTNYWIPGDYSHTAIVKDKFTVIEATTHGVVETDLIDFILTNRKCKLAILNPLFATLEEMQGAVVIAQAQIGKPYKFNMEFSTTNISAFYCSMLNYYSYLKACNEMPFKLRSIIGLQTVAPADFVLAVDKFELVAKF